MASPTDPIQLIDEIKATLEYSRDAGWQGFDGPAACVDIISRWGDGLGSPSETLDEIGRDLGDCRRCKLAADRTRIVFGEGDPRARLVFVGEGPGFEEDRQGKPFVGAAGQLLTRIIQAIGFSREDVYICNIVKCRPPRNRNPEPDEIDTCLPFLKRQLAAIGPEFVCALGSVAAQVLLQTSRPISKLRGRFYDMDGGIKVLPTYHPAYLLRNTAKKRDVWEDMQLLMKAMGIERQGR